MDLGGRSGPVTLLSHHKWEKEKTIDGGNGEIPDGYLNDRILTVFGHFYPSCRFGNEQKHKNEPNQNLIFLFIPSFGESVKSVPTKEMKT